MEKIAVCIPTRKDMEFETTISYPLICLAFQTWKGIRIYIRDEGKSDIFANPTMRLVMNLLVEKDIEVIYYRSGSRKGVGFARYDLYKKLANEQFVLWLDDDMIIEPDGITELLRVINTKSKAGFVQGTKKELNPLRKYFQDINVLNSDSFDETPFRIYFGDAAYLLARRQALDVIDWELIRRCSTDGLAGEDVLMSLMMAQQYEGWGAPRVIGYHVSPLKERWRWEVASDALQIELLKNKVDIDILKKALPHMEDYIAGSQGCKEKADETKDS